MRFIQRLGTLSPFLLALSSFLGLAWIVFVLAIFGLFSPWIITFLVSSFSLAIIIAIVGLVRSRDWWRLGLFVGLSLISTLIALTNEPTVFSGRDQGSIAEAAWHLAEEGDLTFSTPASRAFFEIYGSGTALNFPGFAYTESGSLITQFPIAYTAWLAAFVSLFGVFGYTLGNLILFFLFGWSLFELLTLFVPQSFALGGTAIGIASFLPVWMAKFTLTENLAIVLFVFLSYAVVRLFKEKTPLWYGVALLSVFLFAFTRIEGFAIVLVVFGIIFFSRPLRSLVFSAPGKYLFLPGMIIIFIFLRDFFINLPFYKMIGKAAVKKWAVLTTYGGLPPEESTLTLGMIFLSYGLFVLFMVALFSVFWLVRKKDFSPFPVLYLAAPTLIYFLLPSITLDHPWMLRRYFFSLYPTALFFATLGIVHLSERLRHWPHRRISVVLAFVFLFFFQGSGFVRALAVTENRSLLAQTASFAERFGEKDLILIDRGASGDPFSMLAGPMNFLYGKQAAYFFNPDDLAKLDLTPFEKVYLLLPEDSLDRAFDTFGDRLLPIETVTFVTERLEETTDHPLLPPTTVTTVATSVLFQVTP